MPGFLARVRILKLLIEMRRNRFLLRWKISSVLNVCSGSCETFGWRCFWVGSWERSVLDMEDCIQIKSFKYCRREWSTHWEGMRRNEKKQEVWIWNSLKAHHLKWGCVCVWRRGSCWRRSGEECMQMGLKKLGGRRGGTGRKLSKQPRGGRKGGSRVVQRASR